MNLGPDVGPFPVGVWAGLIGTGALVGLAVRRAGLLDDPEPPPVLDEPTPLPQTGAYRPATQGAIILPGGSATPAPVDPRPTSNTQWLAQAVDLLITRGVTPTVADTALRKYLQGLELGQAELAAVNIALGSPLGVPPEGAPAIKTTTVPDGGTNPVPAAPTPQPAEYRKAQGTLYKNLYTVVRRADGKGETARQVAAKVYGDPNQWNYIRFGNPQAVNADGFRSLRIGTVLRY